MGADLPLQPLGENAGSVDLVVVQIVDADGRARCVDAGRVHLDHDGLHRPSGLAHQPDEASSWCGARRQAGGTGRHGDGTDKSGGGANSGKRTGTDGGHLGPPFSLLCRVWGRNARTLRLRDRIVMTASASSRYHIGLVRSNLSGRAHQR